MAIDIAKLQRELADDRAGKALFDRYGSGAQTVGTGMGAMSRSDYDKLQAYKQKLSQVQSVQRSVQNSEQYGGYGSSKEQLIGEYQGAQDKANAANEARYQDIKGGYEGVYDRTMTDLKGSGTQRLADVREGFDSKQAALGQNLVSKGMYNPALQTTLSSGIEREKQAELRRQEEAIRKERIGYDVGLTGDLERFKERKTESGPNEALFASLMQKSGAGSAPSVSYSSSGRSSGSTAAPGGYQPGGRTVQQTGGTGSQDGYTEAYNTRLAQISSARPTWDEADRQRVAHADAKRRFPTGTYNPSGAMKTPALVRNPSAVRQDAWNKGRTPANTGRIY